MRLGFLSDLHYDLHDNPEYLETLIRVLAEAKLDVLLNGGDLAEALPKSLELLEALRGDLPRMRHIYVPGNHDLWNKHLAEGTPTEWVVDQHRLRPECLWDEARDFAPGWAVVGGCGWYDYSLGDARFSPEELAERSWGGRTWQDKLFVSWGRGDVEVHDAMITRLRALIEKHQDRQLILLTHHINHSIFTVPADRPGREQWAYFNAFLGSQALQELSRSPQVKIALSGHVHYRHSFDQDGTHYSNRGLGYEKEFKLFGGEQDLASQLRAALEIFEL